jgi:hypothetical protein
MAGYSGTPLPKKLGIKEGATVAFPGEPGTFRTALGALPQGVTVRRRVRGPLDLVVAFVTDRADLAAGLPALMAALTPEGSLWVAWPKRASGVATDVTEDVVREVALPLGLVDNKVCAIDDVWSGLRLVLRKELRPR